MPHRRATATTTADPRRHGAGEVALQGWASSDGREHLAPTVRQHALNVGAAISPIDDLLLRVVDGGLAASLLVAPFLMGGRHAVGQLALTVFAVLVASAWLARQALRPAGHWRWSLAEPLLAGGMLVLALQLAPLSPAVLAKLSPQVSAILPLWSAQADPAVKLGVWSRISLAPAETRGAVTLFLSYAMLFVITLQRIRTIEDIERLLRWCALAAVSMAAFGLVQLFTSNGKFFWTYPHPFSTTNGVAKGAFTNRNHFAHFLALGVGPLIWWLQDALRNRLGHRQGRPGFGAPRHEFQSLLAGVLGIALAVLVFAMLLSLSRGGALATCVAAGACTLVCCRCNRLGPRFLLGFLAVGLLVGASLWIFGYDRVAGRLDTLAAGSIDALDTASARRNVWTAAMKAIPDYRILGAGVGSHREVSPMYLPGLDRTEFTHAENGYLQVGLETGLVGLGLLLCGIGLCAFWCVGSLWRAQSHHLLVCAGAITGSLAASLVQSCVDFVWYVPACMAVTAILAACACRVYQLSGERSGAAVQRGGTLPRWLAVGATVIVALAGVSMVAGRVGPALAEPHWTRYLILAEQPSVAPSNDETAEDAAAVDQAAATERVEVASMLAELQEVIRWQPHHARARLRLAAAYLRLFDLVQQTADNPMPVGQIRDAAICSRFPSRPALDAWLGRAVGDHRRYLDEALQHARRGLALCPLQGEGYLYLNELRFLFQGCVSAKDAYVDQALRVRPYNGPVLLEAGREAWLAGDNEKGLRYWQEAFRSGRSCQRQLVQMLVGRVPLAFFLDAFQPSGFTLHQVYRRCQELGQAEASVEFCRYWSAAAQAEADASDGGKAAYLWLDTMAMYNALGQPDQAALCSQNALRSSPNSFDIRYQLALALITMRQFSEAEGHLQWCLARKPGSRLVRRALEVAVRQRISVDNIAEPATARAPDRQIR